MAAIAQLIQDKNIKLKINKQVELLVAQSKECTAETASALRLYKNESASICGKSYEYPSHHPATNPQSKKPSSNCLNWASSGTNSEGSSRWPTIQCRKCSCPSSTSPQSSSS